MYTGIAAQLYTVYKSTIVCHALSSCDCSAAYNPKAVVTLADIANVQASYTRVLTTNNLLIVFFYPHRTLAWALSTADNGPHFVTHLIHLTISELTHDPRDP